MSVARVGVDIERAGRVLRFVDAVVVDSVGLSSEQGVVAVVEKSYGKAAAEVGDAGDGPAFGGAVGDAEEAIEGKFVGVADNEVMLYIESGECVAERGIDGIDFFADVGGLIHGFAEGIAGKHLQAAAGVAEAEFEGVVIGVADGGLIGIAAEVGAERSAGSVDGLAGSRGEDVALAEGAAGGGAGGNLAGLAQAEAERGIAGIGFDEHEKTMRFVADIAGAEDGVVAELALEGDHV